MIIDGKELYHVCASLKDLGKKWFAFSVKRAPKPHCCSLYQSLAYRISFRAAGRMTMR